MDGPVETLVALQMQPQGLRLGQANRSEPTYRHDAEMTSGTALMPHFSAAVRSISRFLGQWPGLL